VIVISDTSPLSVLAEIGELELLRRLYGQVVIPESVRLECIHPAAPQVLAAMIADSDPLFQVVPDPVLLPETAVVDPGEAAAISLAWHHRSPVMCLLAWRDSSVNSNSDSQRRSHALG
jgi:hypothetical protein